MGFFCNKPVKKGKLPIVVRSLMCLDKLIIYISLIRSLRQWRERRQSRHRAKMASEINFAKTGRQSFPVQASPTNGPVQHAALVLAGSGQ